MAARAQTRPSSYLFLETYLAGDQDELNSYDARENSISILSLCFTSVWVLVLFCSFCHYLTTSLDFCLRDKRHDGHCRQAQNESSLHGHDEASPSGERFRRSWWNELWTRQLVLGRTSWSYGIQGSFRPTRSNNWSLHHPSNMAICRIRNSHCWHNHWMYTCSTSWRAPWTQEMFHDHFCHGNHRCPDSGSGNQQLLADFGRPNHQLLRYGHHLQHRSNIPV